MRINPAHFGWGRSKRHENRFGIRRTGGIVAGLAVTALMMMVAACSSPPSNATDTASNSSSTESADRNGATATDTTGTGASTTTTGAGNQADQTGTGGTGTPDSTTTPTPTGTGESNAGNTATHTATHTGTTGIGTTPLNGATDEACILPPNPDPRGLARTGKRLMPGDVAPEFELTDIQTGEPLSLSALRGRYVVLKFWHSQCIFCQRAGKLFLRRVHDELGSGPNAKVAVVTIGLADTRRETLDAQKSMSAALGFDWPIGHDASNSIKPSYGLQGVPVVFLIDPEGHIITYSYLMYGADDAVNPWAEQALEFLQQECTN